MTTTRDAILDGAMHVIRTRGLARTTTKEIAAAAGYSEPMLYRFFADKTDLFLAVLAERLPGVGVTRDDGSDLAGSGTLRDNVRHIVVEMTGFYLTVLPLAMSIFSDAELLARHRDAVNDHGTGPEMMTDGVRGYLAAEQAAGRIDADAPIDGVAFALAGAAQHRAFLWSFNGRGAMALKEIESFADEVVAAALPALSPTA